jgi:hypothetical protein
MTRLAWVPLSALAFGVACGGSDEHAAPGPSEKDSGTGGKKGSGGAQNDTGGTISRDAGATDSGGPADTTPPDFAGADGAQALGEDRARVTWKLATDPGPGGTPQDRIAYRAYRSATAGGEDFSVARRCGEALPDSGPVAQANAPCYASAPAGATSLTVHDAIPNHTFFYVVRAVDAAGNEDGNTIEVSAKNDDETAPEFSGVSSVSVDTARSIEVGWNAGYDLAASDSQLTFNIYVGKGVAPNFSLPPTLVTKPGVHSAIVTGLDPLTSYFVAVRAADPSGNKDTNTRVLSVTTPEGVAPTFDGAKLASADGMTVRVFWPPATDNKTDTASIVFDVYETLNKGREDYSKPSYTSAPGASSIVIQEPNAGTRYYFVVRARDIVGNESTNVKEVSVVTGLPDNSPPNFSGANSVTSRTPTSLDVTWTAAEPTDTYLVYVSTSSPVPLTTPALTTRGVAATLIGLAANTAYNVVVLAEDSATPVPNRSTTIHPVGATTLPAATDTTPPSGTGSPTAVIPTTKIPTQLSMSWAAANDDTDGANVRYHICAGAAQSDCTGSSFASHIVATTAFGSTSVTVSNLTPRTTYSLNIRAEDNAGNVETADHLKTATTATSWSANVRQILFDRCVACHDYQNHATIFNVEGSLLDDAACSGPIDAFVGCQLKLIDPGQTGQRGRPEFSIIYRKVNAFGLKVAPFSTAVPNNYQGAHEPRDTPDKLSGEEDDILRDWIEEGATAN